MRRRSKITLIGVLLSAMACFTVPAAKQDAGSHFVAPFPAVMYPAGSDAAVVEVAEEVGAWLGIKMVQEANRNPVCCIWIEVTKWTPNPGQAGYVIVNQPGGIISASTVEQLVEAVKKFKASTRDEDAQKKVPIGLMTNYTIIENK